MLEVTRVVRQAGNSAAAVVRAFEGQKPTITYNASVARISTRGSNRWKSTDALSAEQKGRGKNQTPQRADFTYATHIFICMSGTWMVKVFHQSAASLGSTIPSNGWSIDIESHRGPCRGSVMDKPADILAPKVMG